MADPLWSNVTLLVPADADANDVSDDARTGTLSGGGQISTTRSKFGAASYYDDASVFLQGGINFVNGSDLLDPSGNFSVQFWIWRATTAGTVYIFGTEDVFGGQGGMSLYLDAGYLRFRASTAAGSTSVALTPKWISNLLISASTWHYVEVTRSSGSWYLFLDGVLGWTGAESGVCGQGNTNLRFGGLPNNSQISFEQGYIDDMRITNGAARNTSSYTPPTEAHPTAGFFGESAWISIPSPVGLPAVVAFPAQDADSRIAIPGPVGAPSITLDAEFFEASASIPSPVGIPAGIVLVEFQGLITDPTARYVMRVTGTPALEIPISSWQATVQSDRQSFLQCVIPAANDWAVELAARQAAEQMVVYKQTTIDGVTVETEMARASIDQMSTDYGASRYTITLRGYTSAFDGPVSPSPVTLVNPRAVSQSASGSTRVRADIDWNLRPGRTAVYDGLSFTVDYINYFVPSAGDAYMDAGSRG